MAQLLVNGLIMGTVYGLIALGFVLVYRAIDTFNFFHGDMYMLGAFFGYLLSTNLQWPALVALPLAVLMTAGVGAAVERIALRPLAGGSRLQLMFATAVIGTYLLRNGALLVLGPNPQRYDPYLPQGVIALGGVMLRPQQLLVVGCTVTLTALVFVFLRGTRWGKAMRAAASNPRAASLAGINTRAIQLASFALSSGLGGLTGVLVAPLFVVEHNMGNFMNLKAFAVAILGGLDSLPGAVVGGVLLGVAENLAGFYLSTAYKDAWGFLLMIAVLVFRPGGILGQSRVEKV